MRKGKINREMGAILVLFVLSLPAILGLSCLALDAGYLYLTKARLDKASRIAAATALNMTALRGWAAIATTESTRDPILGYKTAGAVGIPNPPVNDTNTKLLEQVKSATIQALQPYFPNDFKSSQTGGAIKSDYLKFLDSNGIESESPGVTSLDICGKPCSQKREEEKEDAGVTFQLSYKAPTLLLGSLAQLTGGGQCANYDGTTRCSVKTAAKKSGYLKPANIVLLLDTSGSMQETVDGETKLRKLQGAVNTFVDMFNPNQDKISLVRFGTTAQQLRPLGDFKGGDANTGFLTIKQEVAALQAGGQTNPCDALLQAKGTLEALQKTDAKFAVLFTDGAPNVYRLDFSDSSRLGEALDGKTPPHGREGWYGWTVRWGRRKLASCPPSGVSSNPRDCDPVYGWPSVKSTKTSTSVDLTTIQNSLRLNEEGQFVWKDTTTEGSLPDKNLALDWDTDDGSYKWYGPSYLVQAEFQIDPAASLIDRIPTSGVASGTNLITCGPGSRKDSNGKALPGALWKKNDIYPEMYNHSLYFASRVINKNWRLTGFNGALQVLPSLSGMGSSGVIPPHDVDTSYQVAAPGYFKVPKGKSAAQPLKERDAGAQEEVPGCLSSLNAFLPGDSLAQIWVGKDDPGKGNLNPGIVSNVTAASINKVGEVVKTAELPYYCAIRAADRLRQNNVPVFTIGLGPSATDKYGEDCNDPMQNALDFSSRKDGFLRRLAYAPESLEDPTDPSRGWNSLSNFNIRNDTIENCTKNDPTYPLEGQIISRGYAESRTQDGSPMSNSPAPGGDNFGSHYGSNDPSQLNGIFGRVAKEVLIRLAG